MLLALLLVASAATAVEGNGLLRRGEDEADMSVLSRMYIKSIVVRNASEELRAHELTLVHLYRPWSRDSDAIREQVHRAPRAARRAPHATSQVAARGKREAASPTCQRARVLVWQMSTCAHMMSLTTDAGSVGFLETDVTQNWPIARHFGVREFPTVMLCVSPRPGRLRALRCAKPATAGSQRVCACGGGLLALCVTFCGARRRQVRAPEQCHVASPRRHDGAHHGGAHAAHAGRAARACGAAAQLGTGAGA